jgi:hypothetical protein
VFKGAWLWLLALAFGFGGWAPSLVVELPAVEVLAFAFGFGSWVLSLVAKLPAVEVLALTSECDGWSEVLAVALLLVAFEVGRGLASVRLGWVFESGDGVEVAVGRYAFLIELYVSKLVYHDGLEDVHINKLSDLS